MEFRTIVNVSSLGFEIAPFERMLFVGSCFADGIGRHFQAEQFAAKVNPFGVMYNPASVLHTINKVIDGPEQFCPQTVFVTLGTNHVYILNATGEIVDNCQKRPQSLFTERCLSVDECVDYLLQCMSALSKVNPTCRVVFTVSPIRYRKYGYHESQLSKATLLLAVEEAIRKGKGRFPQMTMAYFPAYEIVNDELRDYRFYKEDMLHPSEQAVNYIWERLVAVCFSERAKCFLKDWAPVKAALSHRPFHPEAPAYKAFQAKTQAQIEELGKSYPEHDFSNFTNITL